MKTSFWVFNSSGKILAQPLIVHSTAFFATNDGCMNAVEIGGQDEKWRFFTRGSIVSTPVFYDGCIYFGNQDHFFYAVDAATGEKKWEFVADRPIVASPVISQDLIMFGSDDGNFYAVDSASGTEKWRIETGRRISLAAALIDGLLIFTNQKGSIYCVHIDDGTIEYVIDGIKPSTQLVSAGELILFGSGTCIIAIEARTGANVWKYKTPGATVSPPVVALGIACFGSANYLYGLDTSDGSFMWEGMTGSPPTDSLTVFEGVAYFTTRNHSLFAVDIVSGDVQYSVDLGRASFTQPAVNKEWILIGGDDNCLYGYHAAESKDDGSVVRAPSGMSIAPVDDQHYSGHVLEHPYSNCQEPWRLFVLALLFPIYEIYWFYRNWKHWEVELGVRTQPGLRTVGMFIPIISYYLAYDQFRMIDETARIENAKRFPRVLVTVGYILFSGLPISFAIYLFLAGNEESVWRPWTSLLLFILSVVAVPYVLMMAQRTNNSLWEKKYPAAPPRDTFSSGEKVILVLGCLSTAYTLVPMILRLF